MIVKELIDHLNRMYDPDDHIAAPLWTIGDIEVIASAAGLSTEDMNEIIDTANHQHEASVGINWDVLENHVVDFLADRRGLECT